MYPTKLFKRSSRAAYSTRSGPTLPQSTPEAVDEAIAVKSSCCEAWGVDFDDFELRSGRIGASSRV